MTVFLMTGTLWSTMSEEVMKTLKDHDKQLDAIAHAVVDHTERLDRIEENMVTKKDHQEVMNALDKIIKLSEKKDQELTFIGNRVRRVEDDVKQIKPLVGLAT